MRFKLYTLIDISETGARRGDDPKQHRQQQNFLTVMQTIGLRVNPTYVSPPKVIKDLPNKYNLGQQYKSKQSIWEYSFEIEYEDALDIETLNSDFDLIPIILGLDETIKLENAVFMTKNANLANIYFEKDDK
jgi:hypothetical protein